MPTLSDPIAAGNYAGIDWSEIWGMPTDNIAASTRLQTLEAVREALTGPAKRADDEYVWRGLSAASFNDNAAFSSAKLPSSVGRPM